MTAYVEGNEDLGWGLSSAADTIIILSGEEATSRIGKSFALRAAYIGFDYWGDKISISYNFKDGIYRGDTLKADNPKIEVIGCKGSVDK